MILALVNRSSFRVGVYRWYWSGNVLVHITFLLQAVALGWHMLDLTGSAFQVGLVAFCYGMPLLVLSPFSGLVADRVKRQWLVQASLYTATVASAILALLAAAGGATELPILLTSFALGTCFAFYAPARMALLPKLVPDDMVFNATTLSYSGTRLMGFFGPVLGGLLLDIADFAVTLSVQTAPLRHRRGHLLQGDLVSASAQTPQTRWRVAARRLWRGAGLLARAARALRLDSAGAGLCAAGHALSEADAHFCRRSPARGTRPAGFAGGQRQSGLGIVRLCRGAGWRCLPKGLAVLVFSSLFGIGLMIFSLMTDSLIACC